MQHEITSLAVLLGQLEDGRLNAELADKLRETVATLTNHVAEHGGKPKAKLVLTLDIKLAGGVFAVEPTYKLTLPEPPRTATVFWATPGNGLSLNNPKQGHLFRDVSGSGETRTP